MKPTLLCDHQLHAIRAVAVKRGHVHDVADIDDALRGKPGVRFRLTLAFNAAMRKLDAN